MTTSQPTIPHIKSIRAINDYWTVPLDWTQYNRLMLSSWWDVSYFSILLNISNAPEEYQEITALLNTKAIHNHTTAMIANDDSDTIQNFIIIEGIGLLSEKVQKQIVGVGF